MTYNEFIQNIINTRGQWNIPDEEKYNCHHIIPRCKGGEPKIWNHKTIHKNLIWLTPEEHYEAHRLLAIENIEDNQIVQAFLMLKSFISNDISFNYLESDEKAYGELIRGLKPWNFNLSKENNQSLLKASIKQSKSKLGRVHIHLNNVDKFIKKSELNEYLELGWELGRSDRVKSIIKETSIEAGKLGKKSTFKGKKMPEYAKNKIREKNSGGIYVYKDDTVKHIKFDELDNYLLKGWVKGNPHANVNRGLHWFTDGIDNILTKEAPDNTWHRGRVTKNK